MAKTAPSSIKKSIKSTKSAKSAKSRHLARHVAKHRSRRRGQLALSLRNLASQLSLVALAIATILTNSIISSAATYASSPEKQIWSFGEAHYLGNKYFEIVQAECNRDNECEKAKYQEYRESGDSDKLAAAIFNTNQFAITSLDPYTAEFSYDYNELAPDIDKRDFDRLANFTPARGFDITFVFNDTSYTYTLKFNEIGLRRIAKYRLNGQRIPYGHYVSEIRIDLKTVDNDLQPYHQMTYSTKFEGCMDDEKFGPGYVCEAYFDADLGLQSRAVRPEELQLEYTPPEPDPEPELDSELESGTQQGTPAQPEASDANPNELTGQPQADGTSNQNFGSNNNLNQSNSTNIALSVAGPATTNNLPLAPNTGLSDSLNLVASSQSQGTKFASVSRKSEFWSLATFVLLLSLANLIAFFRHLTKNRQKMSKKSRKTVDNFREVR